MGQQSNKSELIVAIEASGAEVVATLRALPPEAFARLDPAGEWTGREILAHIASIEWTYPRLLDIGRQAQASGATSGGQPAGSVRRTEPGEAAGVTSAVAQGGIDGYNERQVQKRADASVAELIDEFRRNREATIAAIEQADESLLQTPIRSAGGVTGPLAGVFQAVAVGHVLGHTRDIVGQ